MSIVISSIIDLNKNSKYCFKQDQIIEMIDIVLLPFEDGCIMHKSFDFVGQ